jgi:hypothetical protein
MAYSIRIRGKTGIWQTEPAIRRAVLRNFRGETVKARVNAITTNPSKAKGDPHLEVHEALRTDPHFLQQFRTQLLARLWVNRER